MSEKAPPSTPKPELGTTQPILTPEDIAAPPEQPDTEELPTVVESPEAQHDQANRFTDAEILGKSFRIRRSLNESVTKHLNDAKMNNALRANMLSTPKNNYLRRRYEAADDKYQRKLAKVGTSRFKFVNNHHNRAANKALGKRNEKFGKYSTHTSMMEGRIDAAKTYAKHNNELYQKKVEAYKTIKSIAEGRKELRHLRRDMKREGVSRQEVNRRLGLEQRPGETPEDLAKRRIAFQQKIGNLACARETVARESQHALSAARRERDKQAGIDRALTRTMELAEHNKLSLEKTTRGLETATHHTARTAELVQELQGELDGVGEDDPRRATLEAKIAKAKAVWEGYATRKEELERTRVKLAAEAAALSRKIDRLSAEARAQQEAVRSADSAATDQQTSSADLRTRINEEQAAIDQQLTPHEGNE
ncbi:MAG TPA: hypothetical protein PKV96_00515 [Candidatus Saccharimonas sp.]|nr:hypothetical protein [Candidatus Saccharimonas sp.]